MQSSAVTVGAAATDQELVSAARAGDSRAFEELYGRYRKRIAGYCYRLTHDHDRADDIAQEVFISALRRLPHGDQPIAFRPWIYEIARNACIDEHRRRSRVREIPIERDAEMAWSGRAAPAPEVVVEGKQSLQHLRGAFGGLSERHHQIIVLRELEGLSYSQIGDRLGMSKMVVESTLFRARRRLSEEYDDLSSGRRCERVLGLLAGAQAPKRLGVRDRRALTRHLAHCESCRREARSLELAAPRRLGLAGKLAALLPFPLLHLPGRLAARTMSTGRGALHAAVPTSMSFARYSDGAATFIESGRAAATAATLLVAVGGGLASGLVPVGGDGPLGHPAPAAAIRHVEGAPAAGAGLLGAGGTVSLRPGGGVFALRNGSRGAAPTAGAGAGVGATAEGASRDGAPGAGRTDAGDGAQGSGAASGRGVPPSATGSAGGAVGSAGALAGAAGAAGGSMGSPGGVVATSTGGISGTAGGVGRTAGGVAAPGSLSQATGTAGSAAGSATGSGTTGSAGSVGAPSSQTLPAVSGTPGSVSTPGTSGSPSGTGAGSQALPGVPPL